jgi:hypothetical protein
MGNMYDVHLLIALGPVADRVQETQIIETVLGNDIVKVWCMQM